MKIEETRKKGRMFISHGETHPFEKRMDCSVCVEVEITFLKAVKKAGGITKFLKTL